MGKKIVSALLAVLLMMSVFAMADQEFMIDENGAILADLDNDGIDEIIEFYAMPVTDQGTVPVMMNVTDEEDTFVGDVQLFEYFADEPGGGDLQVNVYLPDSGIFTEVFWSGIEVPVYRWLLFDVENGELVLKKAIEDPGYTLGVCLTEYTDLYEDTGVSVYAADEFNADEYKEALDQQFAEFAIRFVISDIGAAYPAAECVTLVDTYTQADFPAMEGDIDESMTVFTVYAEGNVKIREGASVDDPDKGVLPKGETAEYLGETETDDRGVDWYLIDYEGTTGWVSSKYAALLEETAAEETDAEEFAEEISGKIGAETEPETAEETSLAEDYTEAVVTGNSINVRSMPSVESDILGVMKKGESAELIGLSSTDDRGVEWYSIKFEGDAGWVSSKYTELR